MNSEFVFKSGRVVFVNKGSSSFVSIFKTPYSGGSLRFVVVSNTGTGTAMNW
jgi:hypothetical protein